MGQFSIPGRVGISIHAPVRERLPAENKERNTTIFQFTLP